MDGQTTAWIDGGMEEWRERRRKEEERESISRKEGRKE